jgi:hypothetical protein
MTRKKIISHLRRVCLHLHFMVNYIEYADILIFVYHCGGPGFAPGSVHLGFVVDEVALGQGFFFEFFGSLLSVSFPRGSTLIYHLGDEQKARWLQFRDIASPHPHEQYTFVSLLQEPSRRHAFTPKGLSDDRSDLM